MSIMAKYINIPNLNMFTYALDECEDYLVLDSYLAIVESGRFKNEKHIKVFEYYHMQDGATLNDNILLRLNGYLRNLGKKPIVFVNGHTTNFAALRGDEKIMRRQRMLDYLRSMTMGAREDFIARKETEAARLPERNPDLTNRPPPTIGDLSRTEVERRRAAVANAQKSDAKQVQVGQGKKAGSTPVSITATPPENTNDQERDFVPESTIQDNVVELISEMHDLRTEVASLKAMLQNIFKNV